MIAAEDLHMLDELIAAAVDDDEEERFRVRLFREMRERDYPLSEKQRKWLRETHERIVGTPHYENLISTGRAPRGREVPTPAVLRNLPKKPPVRKVQDDG